MKTKTEIEPYEQLFPWTSWLSRHPFKVETRVRAPLGIQIISTMKTQVQFWFNSDFDQRSLSGIAMLM